MKQNAAERENIRLDNLTTEIESYFDTRDPYIVPTFEPQVERHIREMFELKTIHDNKATLQCLWNAKRYTAVVGEIKIAQLLKPGDIFLMAIIERQGKWRVWHMSPPYE